MFDFGTLFRAGLVSVLGAYKRYIDKTLSIISCRCV
jgi:hypothetical protein